MVQTLFSKTCRAGDSPGIRLGKTTAYLSLYFSASSASDKAPCSAGRQETHAPDCRPSADTARHRLPVQPTPARRLMRAYILRRLMALLPTLVLASIIVFVTVRLIPGDVIDLMLSQNDVSADKKTRDDVIAALGFDKPMWQQYLRWVSAIVLHGDLGKSLWQGTPVTEHLLARLPVTFELGAIAMVVGLLIALPIGI